MSQMFKNFLASQEIGNYKTLKMFYRVSFMNGVNFKYKTSFRDPVKLLNLFLVTTSLVGLCAQYCLLWHKRKDPFTEMADPFCTANQVWISVLKLIYLAFVQHEGYELLNGATRSTLLFELDIFDLAINCKQKLLDEIKDILDQSWLHIKHQLNLFAFLCLMVCGNYMFSCLFTNYYFTYVQPQNFTLQLPVPALFPMWHDYGMASPYYPIQYIITGTENYICGMSAVCFDGLFIIIVVHCSALFAILRKLVEHATDEDIPQNERVRYLICCVRLHQRIYRYYEKINALYMHPSLVQCLLSILVLCVVLFMASVGLKQDIMLFCKMMLFLFAAVYQITVYCYNGQKITTQTEQLPLAWHSCLWYNESKQFKYIINMMILRCNRTLSLKVSGFATMSHITLLSILQSSISYYLFLNNYNVEE